MNQEIYLDNNATTKPLQEVCDAMLVALSDGFGNPSSSHGAGDRGRDSLRKSRHSIARLLGAVEDNIFFTGGGTESNNMVLLSAVHNRVLDRCCIVTTSTEHSSVLKTVEHLADHDIDIVIVPVNRQGLVDLDRLEREVTPGTSLVSVQWRGVQKVVRSKSLQVVGIGAERSAGFQAERDGAH